MKSLTDCYRLSNGVEIPCIGFGTWQTPDGDVCVSSVKAAIEAGYRHIDTAEMYENEDSVGKAIKESGIDRKELFITSKLSNQAHGYEKTMEAFEGTMEKLGLDYLDMFLIHWPNPIAFRDHWQEANAGSWPCENAGNVPAPDRRASVSGYLECRELSGRNRADGERGCKVYGYKENRYP